MWPQIKRVAVVLVASIIGLSIVVNSAITFGYCAPAGLYASACKDMVANYFTQYGPLMWTVAILFTTLVELFVAQHRDARAKRSGRLP